VAGGDYSPQAIVPRTRRAIDARGLRPVVGDYARFGFGLLGGLAHTRPGEHGGFEVDGELYAYAFGRYKHSWLTERAVEVPLMRRLVARHAGRRILEVGNVLRHYGPADHLVVDKYESAPGVLNRDVFDLDELGRFDLIVAISTIEHVGWDESPRDPARAPQAVHRLRSLLAPGGVLVLTVPVGYHPGLDSALRSGELPLTSATALRRERLGPHWRQAEPDAVWGASYDFLLYSARAVVVATIEA